MQNYGEKENEHLEKNLEFHMILIQKGNMELSKEVFEQMEIKFKNGVASSTELLEAETSTKEAQTNYYSAFNIYKKLYPILLKSNYARIINLTSIFSTRTIEKRTSYTASKAALLMLTKSLALEWSKHNITVNSISPGPFLTEINLPVLKNKKEGKGHAAEVAQRMNLGNFMTCRKSMRRYSTAEIFPCVRQRRADGLWMT